MKLKYFISYLYPTSGIALIISNLFSPATGNAQIIPDQTLGAESSVIQSIDQLKEQIEGGAIRGSNLFIVSRNLMLGKVEVFILQILPESKIY